MKKSGPAIFMYCVIAITVITSIICFYLYYKNIYNNEIVLWIGITAFTITMTKSELDHWINEVISLSTLLFAIPWGQFWIFLLTAIAAMIFDSQFIIIQRYNRPRVIKIIEKESKEAITLI